MARFCSTTLLGACIFLIGCNRFAHRQPSFEGEWVAVKTQTVIDTLASVDFTIEVTGDPSAAPEPLELQKRTFDSINHDAVPDGVAALMSENTALILLDIKKDRAAAVRFADGDGGLVGGMASTWTQKNLNQLDLVLGKDRNIRLHLLDHDQLLMTDGSGKAVSFMRGQPVWFWFVDLTTSASPSSESLPKNPAASPSG